MKAPFADCNNCTLINNIFVPSEYHKSRIAILAEAPGYYESIEGKPLVGVAGQEFNRIVESIGVTRENFAILINSVSCRPTKIVNNKELNRTPTNDEIKYCNERLAHEIEQYDPLVIVAMGKIPYIALGGTIYTGFKMGDVIGKEFMFRDKWKVIVTYHPAAISHSGGVTSENGKRYRDAIKNVLEKSLEVKPQEVLHKNKQLELF